MKPRRINYSRGQRTADEKRAAALMFLTQCTDARLADTTPATLARAYGLAEQECASLLLQTQLRRSA